MKQPKDDGPQLEDYLRTWRSFEHWSYDRRKWAKWISQRDRLYPFKPTKISVHMSDTIPLVNDDKPPTKPLKGGKPQRA